MTLTNSPRLGREGTWLKKTFQLFFFSFWISEAVLVQKNRCQFSLPLLLGEPVCVRSWGLRLTLSWPQGSVFGISFESGALFPPGEMFTTDFSSCSALPHCSSVLSVWMRPNLRPGRRDSQGQCEQSPRGGQRELVQCVGQAAPHSSSGHSQHAPLCPR